MLKAEDIVEMARDAARWRWYRENWYAAWNDAPEVLDEYVDAKLAEQEQQ